MSETKKKYKKNICKVLLALMLTVLALNFNSISVRAKEILKENNGDFTISNGVLTVYHGENSVVVIPSGVTEIKANAFENNKTIIKSWNTISERLKRNGNNVGWTTKPTKLLKTNRRKSSMC